MEVEWKDDELLLLREADEFFLGSALLFEQRRGQRRAQLDEIDVENDDVFRDALDFVLQEYPVHGD
eukprot:CAMPEP_0181138768 /NCGR_PEP_ID=MMETSP1071-20121207/34420_1 /TAXON_ID=35127 /ORGANISM="Thalassiosira sp., Strain NH16" /LENGTH=65 /DNA_ID=CAMNT_0023225621 /DNA_START=295 /DNA_END=493 /DNA_ORIENTATION=+